MRRSLFVLLLVLAAAPPLIDAQSSFRATRGRTGTITEIVPPPDPGECDTPMESGQHPRLMITDCDIEGIKTHLNDNHDEEFQRFIDMVSNPTVNVPSGQRTNGWRFHWTSQNFGFLALLGAEAGMPGYNWPDNIDTPDEICDAAYTYYATTTTALATLQAGSNYESATWGTAEHGYMNDNGGQGRPAFMPFGFLWDYCYDYLDATQKTDIVDSVAGYWNAVFQVRYNANPTLITALYWPLCGVLGDDNGDGQYCSNTAERSKSASFITQNQQARHIEARIFWAAFANDPEVDAYDATLSDKWASMAERALRTLEAEYDDYWAEGQYGYEGLGGYERDEIGDTMWPAITIAPAFGEDWIATKPYFRDLDEYVTGITRVHGAEVYGRANPIMAGTGGTDGWSYPQDIVYLVGQHLARVGETTKAAVLKYVFEDWTYGDTGSGREVCGSDTLGTWACAVRSRFLGSWAALAPVNPNTVSAYKAVRHGFDLFTFSGDLTNSGTQVAFFASRIADINAHESMKWGRFDIFKKGNLILGMIGNGKSGPGSYSDGEFKFGGKFNYSAGMWIRQNGVSEPQPPNTNGGTGWVQPTNQALLGFSADGSLVMSNTEADYLPAYNVSPTAKYGYVRFDCTKVYTAAFSTGCSNEFLYLRGTEDHEFVIRMDRIKRTTPGSYTRSFVLPVTVEPNRTDGSYVTSEVTLDAAQPDLHTVVSSTPGNPGQITISPSSGDWATNDTVTIVGHSGTTPSIDGTWTITRVSSTVYTLQGSNFTGAGSGGTATEYPPRVMTKHVSSNATRWTIENVSATPLNYSSALRRPSTDGKLCIERVAGPATYTITIGGGDYVEAVYADFGIASPKYRSFKKGATTYPTRAWQEHMGWGRIQEDSDSTSSEDDTVWAFQIGTASTMASCSTIDSLTSSGGEHIGAHIKDTGHREWTLLWVDDYAGANTKDDTLTFSFVPVNEVTHNLSFNMTANLARGVTCTGTTTKTCVVGATGGGATTVTTTAFGVLEFKLTAATNAIATGVE